MVFWEVNTIFETYTPANIEYLKVPFLTSLGILNDLLKRSLLTMTATNVHDEGIVAKTFWLTYEIMPCEKKSAHFLLLLRFVNSTFVITCRDCFVFGISLLPCTYVQLSIGSFRFEMLLI